MATLQTQYQQWLQENPDQQLTYEQWFSKWGEINGLPIISDDFQIGPNGAYEHVGNELDLQYQDLLQHILDNGVEKKDRTGTGTLSVFGHQIRHNMRDGFPLLTTKKMAWKTMVTELLWFLRGDTNIKFLHDNGCRIWDGDYAKSGRTDGELGPIYGAQWRNWGKHIKTQTIEGEGSFNYEFRKTIKGIDQIANLISELKTNPDSRRLMVNAWNVGELDQMVLPPCHYGFQVYTRELSWEEKVQWVMKNTNVEWENLYIVEEIAKPSTPKRAISLMWNQRSVDTFLGLPFNIASYGLLLEIIAKEVNMIPDELIGNLGDVHLYLNHIEQAKEQISRVPFGLPIVKLSSGHNLRAILKGNFDEIDPNDIMLINYQSHPTIKAPLSN